MYSVLLPQPATGLPEAFDPLVRAWTKGRGQNVTLEELTSSWPHLNDGSQDEKPGAKETQNRS